VLADIEESALMQTKRELEGIGAEVLALVTDVSNFEEVEQLAERTLDSFGAIHLLFNNAGVDFGGCLWKSTLSDWKWVLGVNLWGVIHGIHVFVPIMLKQDIDCYIINTASLAGLISYPSGGIYKVTKHAVVTMSETLYHELNQIDARIRVSVLCTAGVRTRISKSERNRPERLSETATKSGCALNDNKPAQKFWQRVEEDLIEPEQVADLVFNAIRDERFYILTHPQYNEMIRIRVEDILEGRNPTNAYTVLE
jgi:NADP-dependent 3-hydroxy acid dehydrogenase YdfG